MKWNCGKTPSNRQTKTQSDCEIKQKSSNLLIEVWHVQSDGGERKKICVFQNQDITSTYES